MDNADPESIDLQVRLLHSEATAVSARPIRGPPRWWSHHDPKASVDFLSNMFPDIDSSTITMTLAQANYNEEAATDALLTLGFGATQLATPATAFTPPVSPSGGQQHNSAHFETVERMNQPMHQGAEHLMEMFSHVDPAVVESLYESVSGDWNSALTALLDWDDSYEEQARYHEKDRELALQLQEGRNVHPSVGMLQELFGDLPIRVLETALNDNHGDIESAADSLVRMKQAMESNSHGDIANPWDKPAANGLGKSMADDPSFPALQVNTSQGGVTPQQQRGLDAMEGESLVDHLHHSQFMFLSKEEIRIALEANRFALEPTKRCLRIMYKDRYLKHHLLKRVKSSPRASKGNWMSEYTALNFKNGFTIFKLLESFRPLLKLAANTSEYRHTFKAFTERYEQQRSAALRMYDKMTETYQSAAHNHANGLGSHAQVLSSRASQACEEMHRMNEGAACIVFVLNNIPLCKLLLFKRAGYPSEVATPDDTLPKVDLHKLAVKETKTILPLVVEYMCNYSSVRTCSIITGVGNNSGSSGPKLPNLVSNFLKDHREQGVWIQSYAEKLGRFDVKLR